MRTSGCSWSSRRREAPRPSASASRPSSPMCGIAGWVASGPATPPPDTLGQMLGAIAHRGPDGSGAVHSQCRATRHEVALGHRRLAIIDPNGAPQPMCDPAAGLTLVFNGEIYNFREL